MGRIFSIIATLSAVMVLLAGMGAYWFSTASAKSAEMDAANSVANSLAVSLSLQLDILQKSVDGLAQSPDVIAALSSGNPEIIEATADKLQTAIPHILRLRLLLPNINEMDKSQNPPMGFGDLEMVHSTLTGKPKPVIQGNAEDRHLAITSAVSNGQQVVGVVLASLTPNLAQQIIAKTPSYNGLIEVKQDQLVLGSIGDVSKKNDNPNRIEVANSRWKIDAWIDTSTSLTDFGVLSGIILIPALLACLAFFVGYRKLNDYFHQDQGSILKAAKDLLQGKTVGNYPMQLSELQPIIAAMVQFKRVIGQDGVSLDMGEEASDKDFFDESFDIDFLEDSVPATADNNLSTPISSAEMSTQTAVPMPSMESWDMDLTNSSTEVVSSKSTDEPSFAAAETLTEDQSPLTSLFCDYDIRGIAGKNLNEENIANIGRAFASEAKLLNIDTIVVARDGRDSSPSLTTALIKGITATGCDVLDIGLVPTPVMFFVSHHSAGRTGIMVTGSHHPAEYNGLKLILNGEPLLPEKIAGLKNRVINHDYSQEQLGSVELNSLFSNEYIGIISEDTHIVRPMTVVLDCANGATGEFGPTLFKTIGCDVVELYCEIDGQFPNHQPDPGNPTNLEALIKAVKLNNADLGIAFDGSGERLGLVDSTGRIIWADRQMMLFARDVLSIKPGTEAIYDAACSRNLPEQIKKCGGRPVLCKSGSTALQTRLKQTGASMAGDINGHFLFNDRWFGFNDALYAAVRMVEILSAETRTSSEIFNDLPDSLITPIMHIPLAEDESHLFIEKMFSLAQFSNAEIINIDGLRAEFPDGWGLVRASSISPALSLRFEADNHDAMKRIQTEFKSLMLQVKPNISLPF
jgi:phosphomannomutase / phosphoglucomutase